MWLAYAAGVVSTLGAEFLLAHFFLWQNNKEVAKATAIVDGSAPWVKTTEAAITSAQNQVKVEVDKQTAAVTDQAQGYIASAEKTVKQWVLTEEEKAKSLLHLSTPVPSLNVSSPTAPAT